MSGSDAGHAHGGKARLARQIFSAHRHALGVAGQQAADVGLRGAGLADAPEPIVAVHAPVVGKVVIEPQDDRVLFVEVRPGDVSEFAGDLQVSGVDIGGHQVLRCVSPAVPNAIAALLLNIRDVTGRPPHAYFGWTEGNPLVYLLKFLAFGEGDTAPVCREVLRKAEPNPDRRPRIHLG